MRGQFVEVNNCVVHHSGGGVFFYNSFRSTISNCLVYACEERNDNEGGGIAFRGGVYDCVISDCTVFDIAKHGIRLYGGGFIGCRIERCLAVRCGQSGIYTKGDIETTRNYADRLTYKGVIWPASSNLLLVASNTAVEPLYYRYIIIPM
jgi:hypothetical protein